MAVQLLRLRLELLRMRRRDLAMRRACLYRAKPWDQSVDRTHTQRMKVIVRRYGWPTYDMVGKRAANAAWLLVQHADHDVAWQERCLAMMRDAVSAGQATPKFFAMLTDRVRVNRGKRQEYGSQWWVHQGVFGPRPIHDRRRLNARRRAVGLPSFAVYEREMWKLYQRVHPTIRART
ncbi:hypothetical protein HY635_02075 [Candidatus Uhrbacteria bacterium]|nr:hypothetical protein [Candidatus Uhrbacteria bacterium]